MLARRPLALALTLVLLATSLLTGCSANDAADKARTSVEQRIEQARRDVRKEFRAQRDKIRGRVREYLAKLRQAVPQAPETNPQVRSRGSNSPRTIDQFMEDVLHNVDAYWTKTLRANDLPPPSVRYVFIPAGSARLSGCGVAAGSSAAFYCPTDDTIYVSTEFAAKLYNGVADGLPGESAGYGHAAGDFAVAYVLAHEYAHNIQQELGIFDNRVSRTAEPYELQADCWAGTWANSVYEQGLLDRSDLDEILNTALAVGDFDVGNEAHHGTPEQRKDAVLTGFRGGDPASCRRYVPET